MKKILLAGLTALSCLFCPLTHAQVEMNGAPSFIEFNYDFKPGDVQEFANPFFWEVGAECDLKLTDDVDDVKVDVLNGEGKLNGHHMKKGQSDIISATNGQHFSIKAGGYAKVRLVNLGQNTIHARCEV